MIVAFDVDGCLINFDNTPHYPVIHIFKYFQSIGCDMVIWSGGGVNYAEAFASKLGLTGRVLRKGSIVPDIAFDDEEVSLGTVNVKVMRDESNERKYAILDLHKEGGNGCIEL